MITEREQKVYVGNEACQFWKGIQEYKDKSCCGGRTVRAAIILCNKKGIIDSKLCSSSCDARRKFEREQNGTKG